MAQNKYTKPQLRERLKQELQGGDKGGAPGQWSARKSQMLASAYKKHGGGYNDAAGDKGGKAAGKGNAKASGAHKDKAQQSLDAWTDEKWTTADGSKARGKGSTKRYLPKKAWDALSPEEKAATEAKKQAGSRGGKQFVGNTGAAKKARKKAAKKATKKASKKASKKTTQKRSSTAAGRKTGKKASARTAKAGRKPATRKKAAAKKTTAKKATPRKSKAPAKRTR